MWYKIFIFYKISIYDILKQKEHQFKQLLKKRVMDFWIVWNGLYFHKPIW